MTMSKWLIFAAGGVLVAGAIVAGPRAFRAARPALKAGLKRGMETYARVRGAAHELAEDVQDLIEEVRADFAPVQEPTAKKPQEEPDDRAAA